jgi:hypothetical protein
VGRSWLQVELSRTFLINAFVDNLVTGSSSLILDFANRPFLFCGGTLFETTTAGTGGELLVVPESDEGGWHLELLSAVFAGVDGTSASGRLFNCSSSSIMPNP